MKTIDESANKYAIEMVDCCENITIELLLEYATTDFKAGVEFAQRWIPVEEELPENVDYLRKSEKNDLDFEVTESVIAQTRNDGLKLTKRVFARGHWIWPSNYDITHWRAVEFK